MYKILNSSIKYKYNRFYPFKNIENVAKRLLKKTTKKTIHFTIIFKNKNKELKYTIKNKKNKFFIKGGSSLTILDNSGAPISDNKKLYNYDTFNYIDISTITNKSAISSNIKVIDTSGSEGIVIMPPMLPLNVKIDYSNMITDIYTSNILDNYFIPILDHSIFTTNDYVGKIFNSGQFDKMDETIKDYIITDLKLKKIKSNFAYKPPFFSIILYNINILPKELV